MNRAMRITLIAAALLLAAPLAARALAPVPESVGSLAERVAVKALRLGDRGEPVAELQRMLATAGFDPGPLDGIFGPLTAAAVKAAQEQLGLEQDGLFGRVTLAGLARTAATETSPAPAPVTPAAQEAEPEPAVQALVFHTTDGALLGRAGDVLPNEAASNRKPGGSAGYFALTFNGAPDPALLPRLLDTLARHDMQATFFIQGETAVHRPDLVAKLAEAGHEIGNGGYETLDMSRLTEPMIQAQLRHTQKSIQTAANQKARFFRPPLGRANSLLRTVAGQHQLALSLWTNVTVRDPEGADPAQLADGLMSTVYPGAVLMLHQDRQSTIEALDIFLQKIRAEGYLGVTLSNLEEKQAASSTE